MVPLLLLGPRASTPWPSVPRTQSFLKATEGSRSLTPVRTRTTPTAVIPATPYVQVSPSELTMRIYSGPTWTSSVSTQQTWTST